MTSGTRTGRRNAETYLVAALFCFVLPSIGVAFTLKSLIMPGRVITGHANIEDDCNSCHERTQPEEQRDLCFACHAEIGGDFTSGNGFHGRYPGVKNAECSTCHAEHEGRNADITGLDIERFEHVHTDFPLLGAHADAACTDCHAADAAYRDAPRQCADCHASDDVHLGTLGPTCSSCHAETDWRRSLFDHDGARFALTGKHVDAVCGDCHEDQVFVGTPTQCVQCHRGNDVHRGRNGEQCGSCHDAAAWAVPRFDHAGITSFALAGSHRALTCESCHVENLTAALPTTCVGCHQAHDAHGGRLGTSCGDCHASDQWRVTDFDHGAVTDFPLGGAHAGLQCTTCHESGVDVPLGVQCASCHEEDPHKSQLGARCDSCHSETAWLAPIRFDHGLGRFPLLGRHAGLACSDCHASVAFHDAGGTCTACHAGDDVHDGYFGQECATCHNPSGWLAWIFDHDSVTAFPLTGAHGDVACASCHRRPVAEMGAAADACGQCHRRDDPHGGRFGADCGNCHTPSSFSELRGR
jgi:hypothetical protein